MSFQRRLNSIFTTDRLIAQSSTYNFIMANRSINVVLSPIRITMFSDELSGRDIAFDFSLP